MYQAQDILFRENSHFCYIISLKIAQSFHNFFQVCVYSEIYGRVCLIFGKMGARKTQVWKHIIRFTRRRRHVAMLNRFLQSRAEDPSHYRFFALQIGSQ